MRFTVLGATGFIGSRLEAFLSRDTRAAVYAPRLGSAADFLAEPLERDLGHLYYCIGLTADFRSRPLATVDAHVCILRRLLERGNFDSLTYLSSTRVYEESLSAHESAVIPVHPESPSHLYNISKLMGESLCFASGRPARVARLSNVFGSGMGARSFLGQVLHEAAQTGRVRFQTAAASAKDYVAVDDVVRWLRQVATQGSHQTYNFATGVNTTNAEIGQLLAERGIEVEFAEGAPVWSFPRIDISRVVEDLGPPRADLVGRFDEVFSSFRYPK